MLTSSENQPAASSQTKVFRMSKILFLGDLLLMPILLGFYWFVKHLISYFTQVIIAKEQSLELQQGLLNVTIIEIPYSKVNAITIQQNWLGRLFNFGTISLNTGGDDVEIVFPNIASPKELQQIIDLNKNSK
jgi:Bacterial membrane flanked domain.